MTMMNKEYEFTLVVSGLPEVTQDVEDKLFEAGCDDVTIVLRCGQVFLTFCREADSRLTAMLGAITEVRKANIGGAVVRVEESDLVTQAEIARRADLSRQRISQYANGSRVGGFPSPACSIGETPLWHWCEVAHWLFHNDLISQEEHDHAEEIAAINQYLQSCQQRQRSPEISSRISRELNAC